MNKLELLNKLQTGEMTVEEVKALPITTFMQSGANLNKRTFISKKVDARLEQYEQEQQIRLASLHKAIPFIFKELSDVFLLRRGLVLVGARSGHAKSTTAANVLAGFIRNTTDRHAIVISNEECVEAVYNRIACVLLGRSFNALYRGKVDRQTTEIISRKAHELVSQIEVVDDTSWDMTCLEDVQAVLEHAAKSDAALVVLDYLQTVAYSREKPHLEAFQVSKLLGLYLKDYGKRATVPIVVFAQLKPESGTPDMSDRIQNDKTIYNHAFSVVEIVPDFKNRTTRFMVHKDRFGEQQSKEFTMQFVNGAYQLIEEI